ncbi:MAG: 3-deoxy-manno-octulosonate cytidylyltransferase [Marinifilaceae bacterium]|jgi:3-deoxy-manno-octulosonate cytidylyltransferase (CMP-KDO synthetase)|nr:3-deoxy-manno-octulosonate cytidylyltransferase [Marinifilaceae bacterium]
MKKIVGIIPARFKSSRFPGKPLTNILDKPMIIWVCEIAKRALGRENVYVATDDDRIAATVRRYGYQFIMTPDNMLTGTDRLANASLQIDADIYINIQGDEPCLNPNIINEVAELKLENKDKVINCYTEIKDEDPSSVNIPKVIVNEKNELIYMSRLAIPGMKDMNKKAKLTYNKQVCVYAFTKQELLAFHNYGKKGMVEEFEDIEILRYFELDRKILMYKVKETSLAVDVESDVALVEEFLRNK